MSAITSPSFPNDLPKLRSEQTARENRAAFIAGIAKITSGFKAGQSSLSAAREDEIRIRDRFHEVLADLRSVAQDTESASDLPEIKKRMGEFMRGLSDLEHDCAIRRDEWSLEIARMK